MKQLIKLLQIGKPKEEPIEIGETKEIEEIYIPPEKRQQIIDDSRLFQYKNGISKNCKLS